MQTECKLSPALSSEHRSAGNEIPDGCDRTTLTLLVGSDRGLQKIPRYFAVYCYQANENLRKKVDGVGLPM